MTSLHFSARGKKETSNKLIVTVAFAIKRFQVVANIAGYSCVILHPERTVTSTIEQFDVQFNMRYMTHYVVQINSAPVKKAKII